MFNSQFLTLPASGRKIHYVESQPEVNSNVMPIVAVHGLGGWVDNDKNGSGRHALMLGREVPQATGYPLSTLRVLPKHVG